ncbi:variant erythrocyte surface antigen-1, alpha subunit [Babesia caballi]|uniref:Variant erythrocyte surface antigen-1, alpha subunit n=1 Tax=Babesia caballi TaxID=5871 RepID=A0AAV4LMB8_BABCB|nr:variant erythrocyte surface antigen-1, alpha subunit [Babesia caballi]
MVSEKNSLKEVPENLKETIDWVLRVTGLNKQADTKKDPDVINALANKLLLLLNDVTLDEGNVKNLLSGDIDGHSANKPIEFLGRGLKNLIEPLKAIGKEGYENSYKNSGPIRKSSIDEDIASIFLGIIPLLFFGLSFIYWMCQGQWSNKKHSDAPIQKLINKVGFTGQLNN